MPYLVNGPDPSPHLDQMHSSTKLRSPIEICGAFLYMIRERFSQGDLRWSWTENPATTGIVIELGGLEETEISDAHPAIFINRGQYVFNKVVLGDKDQEQPLILKKRLQHFYAVGECDLNISCISKSRFESEEIGSTVANFIHKSSRDIMGVFGLYDISPISLSTVSPYEKDDTLFQSNVIFRITFEDRWATVPAAPALKKLLVTLKEKNATAAEFIRNYIFT